jgi:lipopolysaccharide export system ATP-binding protein
MITTQNLTKQFGQAVCLDNVSLELKSNDSVALMGANGAGKTTCFYMIVGLVQADNGAVKIKGQDISALPMHGRARQGIGYLPQEASIFRKLSVKDNLLAILETRKDLDKQAAQLKMEELLKEFHITHIKDSMGMSLSGGERRRVEIARALATEPEFILLDEPFAGVDPISVNDIKQTIRHLQSRGIGILITDHNVRETLDICEKAYIVSEGTILANGTPADIMANEAVRNAYLGDQFKL